MATCGEVLITLLAGYGIDTVFGIPGVHTVELYRGLGGNGIRHVTPRHEQGAGFAADGYARISGKPAACLIITGPGMTNIATAMGQAYADSIPMLVISSVSHSGELAMGEGRLHELPDQRNVVAGVSAFSHTLLDPDNLPAVLARAFAIFSSARPRPVHIEIPLDVITMEAGHLDVRPQSLPARAAPDPDSIAHAAAKLQNAKRPLVLVGGGCADASEHVTALIDSMQLPFAPTINGKGVMSPGHPLCVGSYLSFDPARLFLNEADVVLALGTELGETDYDLLFRGGLEISGTLIRVDIDAEQFSSNIRSDVAILGDAGLTAKALLDSLEIVGRPDNREWIQRLQGLQAEIASRNNEDATLLCHKRLFEIVDQKLGNTAIVGDSTQPVYTSCAFYEPKSPRSFFNSTTGYGTLGYALPAAIGASLAKTAKRIVCVIGDGGLQFTLPELATAVEEQVPIVILLWNNLGYGEIKKFMNNHDVPLIGVDIYTPDFAKIAEGFGAHYDRARSFEEFEQQLDNISALKGPAVIELLESDFL